MSEPARRPRYTVAEYLEIEERSTVRHEFLDGEILAMAGGTLEHGAVCGNVIALLHARLERRPCRVFTSDVRVRIQATGLDTYPDVSVACGDVARDPEDGNALANPVLLVEVTSPRTEDYDRGDKLAHYRRIPSLREVVFVAHDVPRVDVWRRGEDDRWTSTSHGPGEEAPLESLGCTLPVDAVYHDPLALGALASGSGPTPPRRG